MTRWKAGNTEPMRIVFMGTPDFAAASLKKLIDAKFDVVGVFTQPDKPRGRGMEMSFSPVKELALENGIPVYQPLKMRDGTALAQIKELAPDILVVVAYGRILPDDILAVPRYGAINVHASLLPKYRGAAPIQWAVLNGDKVTGVTTMYLASEMDTGDTIYTAETEIGEYETSGELFDRLKDMGAELLVRTLRDIAAGTAPRIPQDHSKASYVTMLDKSVCPVDWNRTPREVLKHIYGLQPWPVATMELEGRTFRVFAAEYTASRTDKAPGTVVSAGDNGLEIACAGGETLRITELQAPGKRRMSAGDFLRGHKIKVD
ncbi:MAG: methionyl-tRNA formyltransferase [Candidatus Limivicinus sp.]|nr:methionyl-tRNA formyltransferase [Candidatus Limivicinus sp.]